MTIEKTYRCNLCHRELDPTAKTNNCPDGWALTWCGAGNARPERGAALEPVRTWEDSPIHLCQICVNAVASFGNAAAKCGELLPNPVKVEAPDA